MLDRWIRIVYYAGVGDWISCGYLAYMWISLNFSEECRVNESIG